MLSQNKKGVSEVISYVLFIIIALGLAAGIFAYLQFIIPKDKATCPTDIYLVVQKATCTGGMLNLTISNRGLFTADGAFVRFGLETKKIKEQINPGTRVYFYNSTKGIGLKPGDEYTSIYDLTYLLTGPGQYGLEITPVLVSEKSLVVCSSSVVTQPISCT